MASGREGARTVSLSPTLSSSETEIASLGLRGTLCPSYSHPTTTWLGDCPCQPLSPTCLRLMPFTNCIRLKRDKTRDARSLGMISTYLHLQKGQPNEEGGAGRGGRPVHGLVIFSTPCTFYKTQHSWMKREREGEGHVEHG